MPTHTTSAHGRQGRASDKSLVATIARGPATELRILLTSWRGSHRVELRDHTATIPGCFMPAGAGITLPVERLHDLIAALQRAEAEAISRGLLTMRAP